MQVAEIEERFKAIEAVIAELPEDYRPFGYFLRLSGARIESALCLTIGDVELAFTDGYTVERHRTFLVERLGGALSANAVDYLLKYIVTSRKAILQHLEIHPAHEPRQVFIDKRSRPMSGAEIAAAFKKASAKCGQVPPISPRDVRKAVISAYAATTRHRDLIITLGYIEAESGAFGEQS